MGINKHFIRWYNGESTIKNRKERDKYQLIRDLMPEEMEECKENEYNFLKRIKSENTIAAIKVLKIGKVWKILIYLTNEATMEKVFTNALEKGIAWNFRQFKKPFKEKEERNKSIENNVSDNQKTDEKEKRQDTEQVNKVQTPPLDVESNINYIFEMPPQRIFPELGGIAQYQKNKSVTFQLSKKEAEEITEQKVVDMVEKYRKGLLKIHEEKEAQRLSSGPSTLKKDNVPSSEVVMIINEQRKKEKEIKSYKKLSWPLDQVTMKGKINECLSPKISELKAIFE
jgi:hypothetical protein